MIVFRMLNMREGVIEYNPIGQAANLSSCNWVNKVLIAFSFKDEVQWNDRTEDLSRAAEPCSFDIIKMGHTRRRINTAKM